MFSHVHFSVRHFSRDRGFTNTTWPIESPLVFYSPREVTVYYGETIFVYGVSALLHFGGFLTAIYVFRIADNEQLQNLVERVFILCNIPNKFIYALWLHMACGFVWLSLMTAYIVVMEADSDYNVKFAWFGPLTENMQTAAKVREVRLYEIQFHC